MPHKNLKNKFQKHASSWQIKWPIHSTLHIFLDL
jgi:hypothetical protein